MKTKITVEKLVDKMFEKQENKPFAKLSYLMKRLSVINKKLIRIQQTKETTLIELSDKFAKMVEGGLKQEAAMDALIVEYFPEMKKIKKNSSKKVSSALSQDIVNNVVNFIKNSNEGVNLKQIMQNFNNTIVKKSLQTSLKSLVKSGEIISVGNTRNKKYSKPEISA